MDRKKIEWVNIIQPGTLVYADDECLNCILRNLVGNAIKFTRSDGEGRIMVSAGKNEGNVKISIKDNGIGIKPDDLPHVFNAYDRGISRDGTNNEPGTGFGLGIVKELVERNNGKVSVESEVGKGTTFTITLPAAKPDAI